MNILILSNLYPPVVFGGYEILCRQAVEELKRRGHDVVVLTSKFLSETCSSDRKIIRRLELTTDFPRPGEDVGTVDFSLKTMQRIATVNSRITREILSETDRFDNHHPADLVFAWCLNRLSLGGLFAAREKGIPIAWTINDEHPKQFWTVQNPYSVKRAIRRIIEQYVYPLATLRRLGRFPITIISEKLKSILVDRSVPIEHAQVIYQGVDTERLNYQPASRESNQPLKLVYAGQLSRAKGVHTILRALAALRQDEREAVRLTILGAGVPEYESELKRIAQDAGIQSRVHFAGKVPHSEISEYYHSSHVLIFSSEWEEPFGLTHIEAMACGCAVISTTTGGSAELIRDGENALAYPAGNAEALADRIRRFLHDESFRRSIARNGREWVQQRHSLTGYLDRLEAFLIHAVENQRKNHLLLPAAIHSRQAPNPEARPIETEPLAIHEG